MTTRNFVPRNNNEGQLGTENKKWNKIYTNEIFATNFTGNLTGTADNAIKDNKSQQIDATYIKNISINNDTLTVTKGNDDSQDITINNISHAISSDNAINANKLQELTAGNSKGQIPINNGIENVNLNAALLNGKASSYFATSNHTHTTATQSSNGYMSNADKKKLDGIASGAEVNQNAFANVKVGSDTIQADAKQDTLELVAGTNIALTPDGNNDKVTIGVTGKVASATTADKVSATASNNGTLDLVTGTMASNDYFRIRIGGSSDAGYAEIATADNGNEPIYIRQYGGSNFGFSDPIRTATILDSSGNTSFPGRVTAHGGCSLGGSLNLANGTLNLAGDDCYFGDQDVAGGFCLKGANDTTKLVLINKDNPSQMATLSYAGRNLISSATIQGNITGNVDGNASTANRLGTDGNYDGNTTSDQLPYGLSWGHIYNNNYPFAYGNLINLIGRGATQIACEWAGSDTTEGRIAIRNARDVSRNRWSAWSILARTTDTVAGATNATNATNLTGNGAYTIGSGGGDTDENGAIAYNNANLVIGSWFSTGFRDLCSAGTPTRVAINHRNGNIRTTGGITADSAMYTPTPETSDNGTRVATTAFVRNLLNGGSFGTISAISLNTNGYVKFSNGFIIQWGSYSSGRQAYPTKTNSFNFPITFPSTCYLVMLSPQDSDIYTSTWTTSTVTIKSANNATSGKYLGKENAYINAVCYIAIGK